MSDLIRRQEAIDAIYEHEFSNWCDKDEVSTILNDLPSADRPQGVWIPATWQDEHCPERLKRHRCSECGRRAKKILVRTELVDNYYCNKAEPITEYTHEEQLSKFCPNCGARMDKE